MTMAPIPRNDQSSKGTHVLQKTWAKSKPVHIDSSHGYSTQAGTHAVFLTVVIYALLLCGLHRKKIATQSYNDTA